MPLFIQSNLSWNWRHLGSIIIIFFLKKEKGTAEMLSVATVFSWWPFIITALVKTSTGLLYF